MNALLFCDQFSLISIRSTWAGAPEDTAKERGSQREVRRTFKILGEV